MRNLMLGFVFVILAILPMGGAAYAQEMNSFSPPVQEVAKAPAVLKLKGKAETHKPVRLDPPSDTEIQTLKRNNSRRNLTDKKEKALQVGLGRTVPPAISDVATPQKLNWQALAEGGKAAQFTVTSPNAAALRVALAVKKMPQGVELRFVGSNPDDVLGPVTAERVLKHALYWSPAVEGDSITVEIYLPPGVTPGDLEFSLIKVSHLLSLPVRLDMNALQQQSAAASCELDAVCYYNNAGVQSVSSSVARMLYTELDGLSYVCTGTLLNSQTPSVPYFYSASHCISDQPTASTLQTYWFYESAACNSTTRSSSLKTLSSGAELLYYGASCKSNNISGI